ncbi:MAG TPA: hypothetical protein VGB19_13990 [Actinomycetota bacterium]
MVCQNVGEQVGCRFDTRVASRSPIERRRQMRTHRRGMAAVIAVSLFAGWLAGGSHVSGAAPSPSPRSERLEFTYSYGPGAACTDGPVPSCSNEYLGLPAVVTPQGVDAVDIVLTWGLKYVVSEGDTGEVWVDFDPHPNRSRHVMRRGKMPLPSTSGTSTTLTWTEQRLPAAGKTYNFFLRANLLDDGDHLGSVETRRVVVLVDIRPAGAN